MAESLAWLFGLFAVGLIAALLWLQRRRASVVGTIAPQLLQLASVEERLKAEIELAKIKQGEVPWFQKGISTTGVVAFFAMLITTGLQTTRVTIESEQQMRLKAEVAQLEAQRKEWEESLSRTSGIIIAAHQRTGVINDANTELLRQRLKQLQSMSHLTKPQAREAFLIGLILRDGATVTQTAEAHPWLLTSGAVGDRVSAAEYYYALDDTERSKAITRTLRESRTVLSENLQIRLIVLDTLLNSSDGADSGQLGNLLTIPRDVAEERIALGREQLQALATRARYTREVTRVLDAESEE